MKCFTPGLDRRVDDVARSLHIDLLKEAWIVDDEHGGQVVNGFHPIKAARQRLRFGDVADADIHIISIQPRTKTIAIVQDAHFEAAIRKSLDKGRAHDAEAASNQNHNTECLRGADDAKCRGPGNPDFNIANGRKIGAGVPPTTPSLYR